MSGFIFGFACGVVSTIFGALSIAAYENFSDAYELLRNEIEKYRRQSK